MDKTERWQLLLGHIRDAFCGGNQAELARRIGKDATYVNRLFYPPGKAGAKRVGPEIMEACNTAFPLPPGFWDRTPEEAFPNGAPGWSFLRLELPPLQAKIAGDELFPGIDFAKAARLHRDDRLRLEGAWLEAASRLKLDIGR